MHLGTLHRVAAVDRSLHRALDRTEEARPSRAAVEFGRGLEQRLPASTAAEDPGGVLVVGGARAGSLGAVLAQNAVLIGRELATPFVLGFRDGKLLLVRAHARRSFTV